MKVKELIEELKKLDGEKTIGYYDNCYEVDEGLGIHDNETGKIIFNDWDLTKKRKI